MIRLCVCVHVRPSDRVALGFNMYILLHDPSVCVLVCSCTIKRRSRAGYRYFHLRKTSKNMVGDDDVVVGG